MADTFNNSADYDAVLDLINDIQAAADAAWDETALEGPKQPIRDRVQRIVDILPKLQKELQ